MQMTPEALRATAVKLTNSLGIPFYIRDGKVSQTGPGERIDSTLSAHSESHGRFTIAAAAKR